MGTGRGTNRSVDFGVLSMFLLQLLQPLLLVLPLLLVQALQVLTPLVLLQHLIAFELLMSLSVIVLQVFGGLDTVRQPRIRVIRPGSGSDSPGSGSEAQDPGQKARMRVRHAGSYRGDEQLQVFGFKRVLIVRIQMLELLQEGGVVHLLGCTHIPAGLSRGSV